MGLEGGSERREESHTDPQPPAPSPDFRRRWEHVPRPELGEGDRRSGEGMKSCASRHPSIHPLRGHSGQMVLGFNFGLYKLSCG